MSAIFGILQRDGGLVSQDTLQAMHTAMAYWGPDGAGTWREGSIGLGHRMLYNTPESLHETLPLTSTGDGLVITAGARLDNRVELCDVFGIPHPERHTTPDSALILQAYQKWGEACPDHLLGDWAFAIWNPHHQHLFIARDHHGNTGLYYYAHPRFFVFASCLKGLFALPGVPHRPNALHIAQLLVAWPEQGAPTCYEEISRLPPAHAMRVGPQKLQVQRYWYLEHTPELRLSSDDEYVEAFLEVYAEAVRCRLRSHRSVGMMLSGGLDSGSVAALTARELRQTGGRLSAFSSVPVSAGEGLTHTGRYGDETPLIEATRQWAGNMDVHYIRAEQVTPLAGIEHGLFIHDEPGFASQHYYWITTLLETAQQQGIGTLLTGQGGNATVSWGSGQAVPLLCLLTHGQWRTLWQQYQTWQPPCRQPLWALIRSHIIRPLIPPLWIAHYKRFRAGQEQLSAINPGFAESLAVANQRAQQGYEPLGLPSKDTKEVRYAIIRPGRNVLGALQFEAGTAFGLEVRDPTMDKRVQTFCLSLPDEQYARAATDRFLIRRAVEGLLPPHVQWNTRRGQQAADVGQRIVHSRQEILAALDRLETSALARHYLDISKMRATLGALQNGRNSVILEPVRQVLLRGLAVGLFLSRFERKTV